jgi:RHS repeat-associated protein
MCQFFLNLPFGETMAEQTAVSYYQTEFKFNGKELDSETGMYYYGARYYDPSLSIWMSVDPLAEQFPNLSPYNYTMNNPINMIDPDGRAAEMVNPVYGSHGGYIGNTSEGFKGMPIIYDGDADVTTMNSTELINQGGSNLNKTNLKDAARDNIESHIANAELNDGLNVGEKITIKSADLDGSLYRANEAYSGNLTILRGTDANENSNSDTYFEPTVENLRNIINFHEINHSDCGLNLSGSYADHRTLAMGQMMHPQHSTTTERFQQFNALIYVLRYKGNRNDLPTVRLKNQFDKLNSRYKKWYKNEIQNTEDVYNGR